MELRPGMIQELGALAQVTGLIGKVKKSRGLRRTWNGLEAAGRTQQSAQYGSWANRQSDPVADRLARLIG